MAIFSADSVHRAFYILCACLIVAVSYRHLWLDADDPSKCAVLTTSGGRWLGDPGSDDFNARYQQWQPAGCALKEYTGAEIVRACTGAPGRRVVFAGDSTVRQLFWAAAQKVYRVDADRQRSESMRFGDEADLVYEHAGVRLEFWWEPFLNGTRLREEAARVGTRNGGEGAGAGEEKEEKENEEEEDTALMLVGGGLMHARHLGRKAVEEFAANVERFVELVGDPGKEVVIAPVQQPLMEKLTPSRLRTIDPAAIDQMNEHLEKVAKEKAVNVLWSFEEMTEGEKLAYGESGFHVLFPVLHSRINVFLNFACNAKAAEQGGYPYDRTCCANYSPLSWVQLLGLVGAVVVLPIWCLKSGQASTRSLLVVALAACYCHFADRTNFFNKVNKHYSEPDFEALSALAAIAGLLFVRRSGSPAALKEKATDGLYAPQPVDFLSRDITDEWKGWMQAVILIYNYTSAAGVLRLYELVRICISSYLFLTGFGHTMYFYQTNDYSFRRVVSVLVRWNLLPIMLSYLMRSSYLNYYFAPLASLWFLVIYIMLKAGQRWNEKLLFVLGKIAVAAITVWVFFRVDFILDALFAVVNTFCNAGWSTGPFRFQVSMDPWTVPIGMLVAILYIHLSRILSASPRPTSNDPFVNFVRDTFPLLRVLAISFAAIVPPVYYALTSRSPNNADYDWWHPLIGWLPVLSYAALRQATPSLRAHHSRLLASLGRVSLPCWLLSQHLLLAGDGRALLSTGFFAEGPTGTVLGGRWKDLLLLGALFFWVAARVATACREVGEVVADAVVGCEGGAAVRGSRGSSLSGWGEDGLPKHRRGMNGSVSASSSSSSAGLLEEGRVKGNVGRRKWWRGARGRVVLGVVALWFLSVTYG